MRGSLEKKLDKTQKNTRQLLLDAAFMLLSCNGFEKLTLAEIAAAAGVSKPAIYRHFTSKDDLLSAMRLQFFSTVLTAFDLSLPFNNRRNVIQLLTYFLMNPPYMGYALHSIVSDENFVRDAVTHYQGLGVKVIGEVPFFFNKEKNVRMIYAVSTVIFFSMKYLHGGYAERTEQTACVFAEKIVHMIEKGWQCVSPIESKRLAVLDELCVIQSDELTPDSRFFEAISSVIKKTGFPGVTVELIAKEMGMAKSSLYSWFTNKEQLMRGLILDKVENLNDVLKSHLLHGAGLSELVYMHMRVTYNYVRMRETIIPIMGWLRMQGPGAGAVHSNAEAVRAGAEGPCHGEEAHMNQKPFKHLIHGFFNGFSFPDTGVAADGFFMERWLTSIVVSLIIQGKIHGLSDEDIDKGIIQMHSLIGCGIGDLDDTNGKE